MLRPIIPSTGLLVLALGAASGQAASPPPVAVGGPGAARCDFSRHPGVVWWGTERRMSLRRLAEHAAPVYWFSPDEPTLEGPSGPAIRIPAALPFEDQPDAPVVYYQYKTIGGRSDAEGAAVVASPEGLADATIDLHKAIALTLKFIPYFPREEGLGGHLHDVEPAEFRVWVLRSTDFRRLEYQCDQVTYVVGGARVTGEAHGLEWYLNASMWTSTRSSR